MKQMLFRNQWGMTLAVGLVIGLAMTWTIRAVNADDSRSDFASGSVGAKGGSMRDLADLCDNQKFIAAIQRLRSSGGSLAEAKRDFRGWLRRQGVTVPASVSVKILTRRSRNLSSIGTGDGSVLASMNPIFIPSSRAGTLVKGHKQAALFGAVAACAVVAGVYVVASQGLEAVDKINEALGGEESGGGDGGKDKGGKKGGKDRGGSSGGGTTGGGTTG